MKTVVNMLIALLSFSSMVEHVSALTFQNGRKTDDARTTISLVVIREGKNEYEVIPQLEPGKTSSTIEHHRVAKGDEDVDKVTHIIVFEGQAGKDNKVPVSSFPKNNLPAGGTKIALPDQDTAYIIIAVQKDGEKTAFEVFGAPKNKQRSRKRTRFFKVITDDNDKATFASKQSFGVKKVEDEEDDDDD